MADVAAKLADMDTVLAESDYLFISVPLSEKTRHLIGEKELAKMKKTAFLINTSRGPVVDEAALIKALREGKIRGAGLDVFDREPTPEDNPLLKMSNVIVTPHNLVEMEEYYMLQWPEKARQVSQVISGKPPESLLNPEVLDTPDFKAKMKRFQAEIK